jgi:hypothetical protein
MLRPRDNPRSPVSGRRRTPASVSDVRGLWLRPAVRHEGPDAPSRSDAARRRLDAIRQRRRRCRCLPRSCAPSPAFDRASALSRHRYRAPGYYVPKAAPGSRRRYSPRSNARRRSFRTRSMGLGVAPCSQLSICRTVTECFTTGSRTSTVKRVAIPIASVQPSRLNAERAIAAASYRESAETSTAWTLPRLSMNETWQLLTIWMEDTCFAILSPLALSRARERVRWFTRARRYLSNWPGNHAQLRLTIQALTCNDTRSEWRRLNGARQPDLVEVPGEGASP